mmetsp:Transcript_127094/g.220255  ORF Transcript_127094/g.220255 Transcript_127094/m.220255 type:complete len:156 (-) Transcript_127094:115-582(-)
MLVPLRRTLILVMLGIVDEIIVAHGQVANATNNTTQTMVNISSGSGVAPKNATKLGPAAVRSEAWIEGKEDDTPYFTYLIAGLVGLGCSVLAGAACWKKLTGVRGTPPPLLADAELSEGDPVDGSMTWMKTGAEQARTLMSSQTSPNESSAFNAF